MPPKLAIGSRAQLRKQCRELGISYTGKDGANELTTRIRAANGVQLQREVEARVEDDGSSTADDTAGAEGVACAVHATSPAAFAKRRLRTPLSKRSANADPAAAAMDGVSTLSSATRRRKCGKQSPNLAESPSIGAGADEGGACPASDFAPPLTPDGRCQRLQRPWARRCGVAASISTTRFRA
jgi:hypothetical protein